MAKNSAYSEEFKETAIKLAQTGDKSIAQVSNEMGLQKWQLYSWIKAAKKKLKKQPGAKKTQPAEASLEQQNRELQKKLKELEMENEILKKAAAYFAKTLL
jgi:transposase